MCISLLLSFDVKEQELAPDPEALGLPYQVAWHSEFDEHIFRAPRLLFSFPDQEAESSASLPEVTGIVA